MLYNTANGQEIHFYLYYRHKYAHLGKQFGAGAGSGDPIYTVRW